MLQEELEVDLTDIYQPGSVLDIPKRPSWDYKLSKEKLEQREEEYFKVKCPFLLFLLIKFSLTLENLLILISFFTDLQYVLTIL